MFTVFKKSSQSLDSVSQLQHIRTLKRMFFVLIVLISSIVTKNDLFAQQVLLRKKFKLCAVILAEKSFKFDSRNFVNLSKNNVFHIPLVMTKGIQ